MEAYFGVNQISLQRVCSQCDAKHRQAYEQSLVDTDGKVISTRVQSDTLAGPPKWNP